MKNLSKILFFILLCLISIAVMQEIAPTKNETVSEYAAIPTSSPNANITTITKGTASNQMVSTNHAVTLNSHSPIKISNQKDPTYLNFLYGIIAIGLCTIAFLFLCLIKIWRDLYGSSKTNLPIINVQEEPKKHLVHA